MALTSIALSSAGQTHYGTAPNNVGGFSGRLAYDPSSPTNATLSITIQNTTDPSMRGCIVGIGLAIPAGSTVTSAGLVYREAMFDVSVGTIDCGNVTSGFGNCQIALGIQGQNWNCAGVIPHGPQAGIRSFQMATFSLALIGTVLLGLTATDWHAAVTTGIHPVFFPVHFRWLNENNIQDSGTQGDDYTNSS